MNSVKPVTVYVSHSSPAVTFRNDAIVPIHAGKAISSFTLDMIGDDTGNNISDRNKRYCELTSCYWAWKNDRESEYLGFMHYRRFLDFRPETNKPKTEHGITVPEFYDGFVEDFGLLPDVMLKQVQGYDMVIPERWDIPQGVLSSKCTVEWQYKTSEHHFSVDFDLTRKVLQELHPEDVAYFDQMASSTSFHTTNMFVMKRDMFHRYCEWIFPVLDEVDKRINYANYSIQEARVIGYLAERLFNVFLLKVQKETPVAKILTLPRVFLENSSAQPRALKKIEVDRPVISVVASTDRAYVAHMAGLLNSVLANARDTDFIDFIILDGGLGDYERKELTKLADSRPHSSLRFIDMSKQFTNVKVHYYFTRSTFYRLSLPTLLPEHDRIIFLDTDMTVLKDLSPLMEVDLNGKLAAAVPDLIMRTFCAMGARSLVETGSLPALHYLQEKIGLAADPKSYFQAGVIVFNLEGMRKVLLSERMINDISANTYWFLDQDVLNKHLAGKVMPLDFRWNTVFIPEDHRSYLSKLDAEAYQRTQSDPWICHYAGIGKPWENGGNLLSHHYWQYVRNTPWYETTLLQAARFERHTWMAEDLNSATPYDPGVKGFTWRIASRFWRLMPRSFRERIMPLAQFMDVSLRRR